MNIAGPPTLPVGYGGASEDNVGRHHDEDEEPREEGNPAQNEEEGEVGDEPLPIGVPVDKTE